MKSTPPATRAKRGSDLSALEDGRTWCLVLEGENSTVRSLQAATLLSMHGIHFMLHEWKPGIVRKLPK